MLFVFFEFHSLEWRSKELQVNFLAPRFFFFQEDSWSTLFNFQGSAAHFLSSVSFSILSHQVRFVKNFLKFLNFFFCFRPLCSLRQLFYSITSNSLCQELFFDFLKSFFFPNAPARPQIRALFPLSGGFRILRRASLSATASLSYHTISLLSSFNFKKSNPCRICPKITCFPQRYARNLSACFPPHIVEISLNLPQFLKFVVFFQKYD